jgi:hypothetical protein
MSASHPAWVLSCLVAAKPASMKRTLNLAYFGVTNGVLDFLGAAPHVDSDIAIERYVRAARHESKADYVAVGGALILDDSSWARGPLFFPSIAVHSGIDGGSQASDKFFAAVSQHFPGSKLYFYKAGTHTQVYLNMLLEPEQYEAWLSIVNTCIEDGLAHQPWIDIVLASTAASKALAQRWSDGEGYPPPSLYKWHVMPIPEE